MPGTEAGRRKIGDTISAQNTFSDWIDIEQGQFDFSLSGTFTATVWVQRSFDGGTTALDVESFTAATEKVGSAGRTAKYRFGIKTGDYTSGSAVGLLGQ